MGDFVSTAPTPKQRIHPTFTILMAAIWIVKHFNLSRYRLGEYVEWLFITPMFKTLRVLINRRYLFSLEGSFSLPKGLFYQYL